jgi:sorbitol/mannitol transport system substrate-binding protein
MLAVVSFGFASAADAQTALTIATVSNLDMERMQRLSDAFLSDNPDISLNWVTLDENTLRQRVTTDIATGAGRFDIVTIGTYEVPIWAERGWLSPLSSMPDGYDVEDLLPTISDSLSFEGNLYAAPFYGESAFTMYRTDLFEQAGLEMPEAPTWDFIRTAASTISKQNDDVYGICLRAKPGWGENIALITAMANSYGARWFDMDWSPVRQRGLGKRRQRLRQSADGVRASRCVLERLRGDAGTLPKRRVRDLDRRDGRRVVDYRSRSVHGCRSCWFCARARSRSRQAS